MVNKKNKRQIIRGIHCRTIPKWSEKKKKEKKKKNEMFVGEHLQEQGKKRKRAIIFPLHFWWY
jgi:hypothetical protein